MKKEILKKQIQYSRTYRYIEMDKINVFLGVFLSIIPLCLLVLFYYPQITLFISQFTMKVLSPIFHENVLAIESSDFLKWFGPVYYLSLPGRFPSIVFIWLNLLITLISLFLLSSVVKTRPLTIFCRSVCGYMFVLLSFLRLYPSISRMMQPSIRAFILSSR